MYVPKHSDVVIVIIKKCRYSKLTFNKVKLFILFLSSRYSVLTPCNQQYALNAFDRFVMNYRLEDVEKINIFTKCIFVVKWFLLFNTCLIWFDLIWIRKVDCSEEILDTPENFYIKYMRTFSKDPVPCHDFWYPIPLCWVTWRIVCSLFETELIFKQKTEIHGVGQHFLL